VGRWAVSYVQVTEELTRAKLPNFSRGGSAALARLASALRWAPCLPVGGRLVGPADAERGGLVSRARHDLQRQRQAILGEAARHREPAEPEVVHRAREVRRGPALVRLFDRNWRSQGCRSEQGIDIDKRRLDLALVRLPLRQGQQVVARGDAATELDARANVRVDRQRLVVDQLADEPVTLRADDPAGGGRVVAEAMGQAGPHDLGAEPGERVRGGVEGGEHLTVDAGPLGLQIGRASW